MELRELSRIEAARIYEQYMINDFPLDELKPLSIIENLMEQKVYRCYGLFHLKEMKAYAFLFCGHERSSILIDFYAVVSSGRNKGYGSKFLNLLSDRFRKYDGFMAEIEKVDLAQNEEERKTREKRIQFYLKNGMQKTSITSRQSNTELGIMYLPLQKKYDAVHIFREMKDIYHKMLPKKILEEYINLYIHPTEFIAKSVY